jgi:hypothetical protein
MIFIHVVITPLIWLILLSLLQVFIDFSDFKQAIKMFLSGLIAGLIINFIFIFINYFFAGRANSFMILIKAVMFEGIFFIVLVFVFFYFIVDLLSDISLILEWSNSFIFIVSFMMGIFSIKNIFQVFNNILPTELSDYLTYFFMLFLIANIISFTIPRIIDSIDLINKSIWLTIAIFLASSVSAFYNYCVFFNYWQQFIIIPIAVLSLIMLYFFDLRNYLI